MALKQFTCLYDDLRCDRDQRIALGEVSRYTAGKHLGTILIEVTFAYLSLECAYDLRLGNHRAINDMLQPARHGIPHPYRSYFGNIAFDERAGVKIVSAHHRRSSMMISERGLPGIDSGSKSSACRS